MTQSFLLDTNVVSEKRKARPNVGVSGFVGAHPGRALFVSALTMGELRKGVAICRNSDPPFADRLSIWIDGLEKTFEDRIVPVDLHIARTWGEMSSDRTRPIIDTLLIATAVSRGLTFVTRNTTDVRGSQARVFNPFL